MSKRKANDVAREHEIRLMAACPIDIPRRQGDHSSIRVPKTPSRRSDRLRSDLSLSIRDSAGSSMSDVSETYTFKVNAFAAWTPRPVIHYVESPRSSVARSRNPSAASTRREKLAISDEDLHSKKRIEELADDLDAGALRELLERDRRRRERKRAEQQEQRDRRLKRRAERDREGGEEHHSALHHDHHHQHENEDFVEVPRGRPGADRRSSPSVPTGEDSYGSDELKTSEAQSGSWLRGPSPKDNETSGYDSLESMQVIGNIDDSSIRRPKLVTRPSLSLSQDTRMSLSTISRPQSPIRNKINSPSTSQVFTQGSTSDISRTMESERRLSEQSSRRMNSLSSFLRRGSSRLKRSYRERVQDQASDFSNTSSHESFFKVRTQSSSGPTPYVPPTPFLRTGTIKRSHSKFTEHFGDEPLSPPDSRLQSPEIPETIPDVPLPMNEESSYVDVQRECFDDIPEAEPRDIDTGRRHSWDDESLEAGWDDNNVPLSQSLASVDSEGSWMSGQFLRRISQRRLNTVRQSIGSAGNDTLEEEREEEPYGADEVAGGEYIARFTPSPGEPRDSLAGSGRASSNALGDCLVEEEESDDKHRLSAEEETWHGEIGRRPVVVSPTARPKSTQVQLLKNVRELSPIFPEEDDVCDAEEPTAREVDEDRDVNFEKGHSREISAETQFLDFDSTESTESTNADDSEGGRAFGQPRY